MERTLESTLLHLERTRLVDDFPAQIGECLDVMTEEDLWWRPDETTNALGNLVLHLAGSNRYYIGYGIGGRTVERHRDAEFAARGNPGRADVLATWSESLHVCAEVLGGLDPARLMEPTGSHGQNGRRSSCDTAARQPSHGGAHGADRLDYEDAPSRRG